MKTCPECDEQIPSDALECPECGEALDPPPFTELQRQREVPSWLPDDLAAFYRRFEGCGLDQKPNREVRLARLDELGRTDYLKLHPHADPAQSGSWKDFQGIKVGLGSYGDEIVCVRNAPVAPAGAIMAFGGVAGPGGDGPDLIEGSLVLALDWASWIDRLRQDGWTEYGLVQGSLAFLPDERAKALGRHFRTLNPRIRWGT